MWCGGIMGSKSQANTKAKERVLAKEAAQRMNETAYLVIIPVTLIASSLCYFTTNTGQNYLEEQRHVDIIQVTSPSNFKVVLVNPYPKAMMQSKKAMTFDDPKQRAYQWKKAIGR
nr:60S ribosomal protein L7a-2 [Tanacetum cinerariifolium]